MKPSFDLRSSALHYAAAPALYSDASTCLSYGEVLRCAERIAVRLSDNGVSPSVEWVAIEPNKDAASVLTIWTLVSLGIPFIVLHPAWSPAQKSAVMQRTRAHFVPLATMAAVVSDETRGGAAAYASLKRSVGDENPLCVVHTSGTTGEPKGVILSRRAFFTSAREACAWLNVRGNDRWFLSLPLAHVGGLAVLARCWLVHASVALPSSNQTSFDPAEFFDAIEQSNATLASLVPTQLQRVCAQERRVPPALRLILLGGAATPSSLATRAADRGLRVVSTYGLTELCSMVASMQVNDSPSQPTPAHSELSLHSHVEAQISPDGRLMLRGASLFSGYWGSPGRTPYDWFTTEDLAQLEGRSVRILGRADDAIVTGGEKVHPAHVENALLACAGVLQTCVFPRPSSEWGEEVCAALVTGQGFSPSETLGYLRGCLPSFNIPRAWVVVDRLPTTPNGKVQRLAVARELGALCEPGLFDRPGPLDQH